MTIAHSPRHFDPGRRIAGFYATVDRIDTQARDSRWKATFHVEERTPGLADILHDAIELGLYVEIYMPEFGRKVDRFIEWEEAANG
jgi:hypothetical protein